MPASDVTALRADDVTAHATATSLAADGDMAYQPPQKSSKADVNGGTPEPATLLLLAGGALAYGGLRRRMKKGQAAAVKAAESGSPDLI